MGQPPVSIISPLAGQDHDQRLKIFPNPNNGVFTVEMIDLESPVDITISNMIGETVFQANEIQAANAPFDLSGFNPGLYFVRVNDGKSVVTKKMIIQ